MGVGVGVGVALGPGVGVGVGVGVGLGAGLATIWKSSKMAKPGLACGLVVPASSSNCIAVIGIARATVRCAVQLMSSALVSKTIESVDGSWRKRQKWCSAALKVTFVEVFVPATFCWK